MASSVSNVVSNSGHFGSKRGSVSVSQEYTPVADFYADRSIFVTGGTGFMGKVLVEKLLRSCPKIKKIYILMRPKRGQDVSSRLTELTNSPLFESLRQNSPQELNKIVPIVGDITEPELGISQADQAMLCQKVSVVFHSAATVKFDEKLKLSVTINMLGTKQLVQICHRMLALEALIHVSTAYCNCDRGVVEERVYAPPFPPQHVVSLVQWMDEDLLEKITPSLIGNRPNTYTFTKALAEDMLMKECGNLPVAIVRPSIVLSSVREPVKGWVDNWNGPNGIIAAAGKGIFRCMRGRRTRTADLVPVDTVINLMVTAAWSTAIHRRERERGVERGGECMTVYNCCTGQQNPISWERFVNTCFVYMRKHPFGDLLWYPAGSVVLSRWYARVLCVCLHRIPAHLIDLAARAAGKKPMMVKVQNKLDKAAVCLEYFLEKEWAFRDENVRALITTLSPEDRETFNFDVRRIDWDEYIEDYVLGIRRFIFKESPASLPKARRQLNRLYWFHRLTQVASVLVVWRFLFMRSDTLRFLWRSLIDFLLRVVRLLPIA